MRVVGREKVGGVETKTTWGTYPGNGVGVSDEDGVGTSFETGKSRIGVPREHVVSGLQIGSPHSPRNV